MKASELAAILLEHPDREVVMSKDGEGNSFSPCAAADTGAYVANSTYRGEVLLEPHELTAELREKGYTDLDVAEEGYLPAFILWPTN